MSWGHAVSRDLVRWEHLPIALREEGGIMIFSGSAVFDARNTSGLGRAGAPPMVAVYTGHGPDKQTQNLASSVDRGRTWAKFPGNPVLDIGSKEFRDPKVFWHEPTSRWVMATVLADKRQVRLWASADLKRWEKLSDFGPAGSDEGRVGVPRPVRGPGRRRQAGRVAMGPQGRRERRRPVRRLGRAVLRRPLRRHGIPPREVRRPDAPTLWIDHGKDFYASQVWNDAPGDGRPIWIAWMNNWQYANEIPTSPWRGAMTAPRRVALRDTPDGLRLVQSPAESLAGLRGRANRSGPRPIAPGEARLSEPGLAGTALEIIAEFEPGEAESFGLKVRQGAGEETVIGFDRRAGEVFVDRTALGRVRIQPPVRRASRGEAGDRRGRSSRPGFMCSSTRPRWRSSPTAGGSS